MMFLSAERKRIRTVPFAGLAGAAGFSALIGYWHRTTSDLVLFGALAAVIWALVLQSWRSLRRVGDAIETWTVFGRRSLGAKNVHVAVTLAGRGPMRVELIQGRKIETTTKGSLIVHQTQLGEGRTPAALQTARQISDVLALGEPLLAPWLENERGLYEPRPPGTRPPRRQWRWPKPSPYTLLVVMLVVGGLVTMFITRVTGAYLTLNAAQPHDVRGAVGTFMINETTTQPYDPGPTFIEVWSPARGCWTHRDLILKEKVRTVLDLDRLAANGPCATDPSAHRPPQPARPRNR